MPLFILILQCIYMYIATTQRFYKIIKRIIIVLSKKEQTTTILDNILHNLHIYSLF